MIPKAKGLTDPFYGSIPHDELFIDPSKTPDIPEATETVEPDHTLFDPGDCSDSIYVLRAGQADIYVHENRQQKTIVHGVEAGRMYGLVEAVSGGEMWYSMKTRTQCTFTVVPRDKFLAGLSRDPSLCFRLAQILSRMNREILSVAAG